MKRLQVVAALIVFLGIALAVVQQRPEPFDVSAFGAEPGLAPTLAPLTTDEGTLELSGSVGDAAGQPAADALIVLFRSAEDESRAPPVFSTRADAGGRFTLERLAPGRYRVLVSHPSAQPASFSLELPHEGQVSWQLTTPLPPLPTLPELRRGELTGQLAWPPGLAEGATATSLEGFEVLLVPAANARPLSGASERRAEADALGRFRVPALVLESYDVAVLPPWARGGSWPVLARAPLDVRNGVPEELVLALDCAAIEGTLLEQDGRPLVGALVRVFSLVERDVVGEPLIWPPAVTDSDGHFRVEHLPPGRYVVHLRAGATAQDVELDLASGQRAHFPLERLDSRVEPTNPVGN